MIARYTRFAISRSLNFCSLPVEVLGNLGEHHGARAFVGGEVLPAPSDQFLGRGRCAGLKFDEGARRLAPFIVGLGDHGDHLHGGMLVESVLDLDRGNILAAGNDDVLGAVLELDIAVGMHHAEIAGVKPAAGESPLGRRLVFQIAFHHDVAAEHHFAECLAVARHRLHRRRIAARRALRAPDNARPGAPSWPPARRQAARPTRRASH